MINSKKKTTREQVEKSREERLKRSESEKVEQISTYSPQVKK